MAFLRLHGISVAYGDRDVLNQVSLSIDSRSRVALAGENGSGKSTLLMIAAGLTPPHSGSVQKQKQSVVSYLPQSGLTYEGKSLSEEADSAFVRLHTIERRKTVVEEELSAKTEVDRGIEGMLREHDALQQELITSGFYDRREKILSVLLGLGFSESDLERPTEEFSGGWQMRIGLAKLLLTEPDIALLDEPTNYLDIEARTWLEQFLEGFQGGVVVVSHDRYFLDVTVSSVAELLNGRLTLFPGNYTGYEKKRAVELESLVHSYRLQEKEIERLESFIRRFRAKPTKAAQVQSRIKQLESMKRIEIPESMKQIAFRFPPAPHSGKIVLRCEGVGRSYGSNRVFDDVSFVLERGDRLVLTGKNGAGKSTLMRILAGQDTGFSGSFRTGSGVRVGYFSQESTSIGLPGTVLEAVERNAQTDDFPRLRDLLGAFLFRGDDVYKPVSVLSGGERSRLDLLMLLLEPVNLLILDEPTNHLDMGSKRVLLQAIEEFGGTLIFVSHDRYFIEAIADRVLELKDGAWSLFPGNYEYYLWRSTGGLEGEAHARGGREGSTDQGHTRGGCREIASDIGPTAGIQRESSAVGGETEEHHTAESVRVAAPENGADRLGQDQAESRGSGEAPSRVARTQKAGFEHDGSDESHPVARNPDGPPARREVYYGDRSGAGEGYPKLREPGAPRKITLDRTEEKALKSRLRKLEASESSLLELIAELESSRDSVHEELAKEENYSDGGQMRKLTTRLKNVDLRRDALTREWEKNEAEQRSIRERLRDGGVD